MDQEVDLTGIYRAGEPRSGLVIRRATMEDLPYCLAIAERCYPGRGTGQAAAWGEWHIKNPESIVLLGPASLSVGCVATRYGYERIARMEVLGAVKGEASVFEPLRHMRMLAAWARERGLKLIITSDTGIDLGPLALRLGGRRLPSAARYEVGVHR